MLVAGQYAALQENHGRRNRELQEATEHMNTEQGRLLAATERKQQLLGEASEEIRVLILEDRISVVESELLETSVKMSELMVERNEHESGGVEGSSTTTSRQSWWKTTASRTHAKLVEAAVDG